MSSGDTQELFNLTQQPALSERQAAELVRRGFGFEALVLRPLPSYDDQNFYLRAAAAAAAAASEGKGGGSSWEFVLKIMNSKDSQNFELIEVQSQIMMFLNREGFPVAAPLPTQEGKMMFRESVDNGSFTQEYMVRLLSYLPGRPLATLPVDPPLLYEIGQLAARLDKTLAEWTSGRRAIDENHLTKFQHPLLKSLHRGEFIWNLKNVPLLKKYMGAIGPSDHHLEMVEWVMEQFQVHVIPKLGSFRPCINHGDLNDHNILLEAVSTCPPNPRYRVSGILDFSDMSYGYYVFEAAITIMYMMIESEEPLRVGGSVLAGFESEVPLTREERGALFLLVCGRFAQSLVMAAHTVHLHPENEGYLMITAKSGWKHLRRLLTMGQEAVEKIWFETAESYRK